jgi:CRP-like cAMP-binding protein
MEAGSRQYDIVRQHFLFSGIDEQDFDVLAATISAERLDKGAILFHRGDRTDCFYYVEEGQVELSLISANGQKKIIEVVGPDNTFAEAIAFMRVQEFPVSAEALTECVLYKIPNKAYLDTLLNDPDACLRLLSDVCQKMHARVREIERLTIQNARSRLASYLIDHVTETDGDTAKIHLDLPRHVIASRLSFTPETLSRMLRSLADEAIITADDRVIAVHSLSRLRPYD